MTRQSLVDQTVAADLLQDIYELSSKDFMSTSTQVVKCIKLNGVVHILRNLHPRKAINLIEELTREKRINLMQYLQLRGVIENRSRDYVFIEVNKN